MKTENTIHIAKDTNHCTVNGAMEELGINTRTILDYLAKGALTSCNFYTFRLIKRDQVEW